MAQLRRDYDKFVERGAEVLVIGPEGPEGFRRYWERERPPFVGLPDPERTVLGRFGQEFKLLRLGRMPAQVVIDSRGVVRWAHYGDSMADIPRNAELLGLLDELGPPE